MKQEKVCILCKEFRFYPGSPGYSDMTPGDDAVMFCYKNLWRLLLYEDSEEDLRRRMTTAETCPDYKYYKEAENE